MLVTDLSFDPEHAEVVAADHVGVVTRLVVDVGSSIIMRQAAGDAGKGRGGIGSVDIDAGVPWCRCSDFHPHIRRTVASHGRRGDCRRRNGGKQEIAHVLTPFSADYRPLNLRGWPRFR
jgi:hypothetical protein